MRFGSFTTSILSLAVVTMLAGCTPTERDEERQPPAGELQSFEPGDGGEAGGALNAPSPVVGDAVREAALEVEQGEATFYADTFEGRRTASGRPFRQSEAVAAHRAFPFGTTLRVTNVSNGRDVEVEVVDRGPFGRAGELAPVLDLSRSAAEQLGFVNAGRAQVTVEVLDWGA